MVILHVALEVLGEVVDALAEQRHLDLRRPGVLVLDGIGLEDFSFTLGRDRHRELPYQRLRTRTGRSKSPSIRAIATNRVPAIARTTDGAGSADPSAGDIVLIVGARAPAISAIGNATPPERR